MIDSALNELLQRLQIWNRDLDDFAVPAAMPNPNGLFELRLRLVNLRRRLRDGAESALETRFLRPDWGREEQIVQFDDWPESQ